MATSATLAMAAKARELRQAGENIIGLSLGEPDFTVPDFVKDAAIKAVEDNYHSYTPVDGYADLKQAIITKFKRDNSLNLHAVPNSRIYWGKAITLQPCTSVIKPW